MATKKRGLGKSLDVLIEENTATEAQSKYTEAFEKRALASGEMKVKISLVVPNADQPRKIFDKAALEELTASVKEYGVLDPLLVRKKGDTYYFIYSSQVCHELCYATSNKPDGDFVYRGVLISNGDMGIDSYKRIDMPGMYCANNHGSIVEILGDWYIFYHRHTNGTNYSRQGCFEKLTPDGDILFKQAEITSCGGFPLAGKGEYPTYIACNLFTDTEMLFMPWSGWIDDRFPKITQEGGDGDERNGYIANMRESATAGFKYFNCKGITSVTIRTKGYANGKMEIKTAWNGEVLGTIPIGYANVWHDTKADIAIPDGINSLYFTYRGDGHLQFAAFILD